MEKPKIQPHAMPKPLSRSSPKLACMIMQNF